MGITPGKVLPSKINYEIAELLSNGKYEGSAWLLVIGSRTVTLYMDNWYEIGLFTAGI